MEDYVNKYIDSFGDPSSDSGLYPKDSRLAKAYEVALDIRKFEIELYWKRSTSFWLLVGGIAAALGLLLSGKSDSATGAILTQRAKETACFLLCLSGATISYAWKLVNDGSKFWQRNWEYQVGILEQRVLGPLYRTVISSSDDKVMYSVSKINGNISRYLCWIFSTAALALAVGQDGKVWIMDHFGTHINPVLLTFAIKILVACAHVWFVFRLAKTGKSRVGKDNFDNHVEVTVRQIFIKEQPYGSSKAQAIWDAPAPQLTENPNGFLSSLVRLARAFKAP